MSDIVDRLEAFNEYCQSSDSKQIMKDAAQEIRRLQQELREAKEKQEQAA